MCGHMHNTHGAARSAAAAAAGGARGGGDRRVGCGLRGGDAVEDEEDVYRQHGDQDVRVEQLLERHEQQGTAAAVRGVAEGGGRGWGWEGGQLQGMVEAVAGERVEAARREVRMRGCL